MIDNGTAIVQVTAMENGIQSISLLGTQIVKSVKGSRIFYLKTCPFDILIILKAFEGQVRGEAFFDDLYLP